MLSIHVAKKLALPYFQIMPKKKTLVLGVTGGIAAYKACELTRLFVKKDWNVHVMMTKAAREFVTPLALQTLSQNPVATDLFSLTEESQIGHIKLADDANVILIAPATANIIAKASVGIADDLVTTVLLATRAKIVMAPSMNVNMYKNPITQENIARLKKRGVTFIDPEKGELACGWEGEGRLADLEKIVKTVQKLR